jgi:hypothetical protein
MKAQFPKTLPRQSAGSRAPLQALRRLVPAAVLAHGQRAAKVILGFGLALLTMNLIALRIYCLPSTPHRVFGEAHEPGKRFRQQVEGNGSGVWSSNCVRRASLPERGRGPVLLILGDSYTEAIQVNDEEHFAHLLEQRLGGIPVLAVGRSGYSVADYVAKAATFKQLFAPDRVIIQVGAGDFQADAWTRKEGGYSYFEWAPAPARVRPIPVSRRAQAPAAPSGSLKLVCLPVTPPGWLSTAVRENCPFWFPLVTFAYLRKSELTEWMSDQRQPWFHARAQASDEGTGKPEPGEYPLEAEMKLLAEAYDGRLTLLYLARFDPNNPGEETGIEQRLHGLARKYGVSLVSLREKFPELAAAGHAPYGFSNTRFNWGHWNRYGHRAAAALLFEEWQNSGAWQ